MRRQSLIAVMLAAAFAAGIDAPAARTPVPPLSANLADFNAETPKRRDPVARFAAKIASTDYAHRSELEEAHRRLESEIDAEIDHRRASGAKLSRVDLRELTDARAMLRSSLASLLTASEDTWERARRQAQLTIEALRAAYSALHPQQLAARRAARDKGAPPAS